MVKKDTNLGIFKKSWLKVGILLIAVLIGAAGCGTGNATPAASTNQGQSNQGQSAQRQRVSNPALQAAMEIRRLQNDQQNPLTGGQKDKLKPILQDLINTANPSQDFLQQKADAINAVLTDQQKSSLTQRRSSNGNNQNASNPNGKFPRRNNNQGGSGTGNGTGNFYQQVLDSLN